MLALAGSPAPGKAPAAKQPVYVLVPKSVIHPYWARCKKGMQAAAKELGVKAVFDGPTNNDLAKQIEIIEGYITRRVSGIAISPNDPRGVEEVIKRAVRRDIPVVTFDSDARVEVPLTEDLSLVARRVGPVRHALVRRGRHLAGHSADRSGRGPATGESHRPTVHETRCGSPAASAWAASDPTDTRNSNDTCARLGP